MSTDPTQPPIPSTSWGIEPTVTGPVQREPAGRQPRGPRMTRWTGCPLISEDDLAEVPTDATLRIRLCISCDGEVVPFDRKPFAPNALTLQNIQKRWGPATYVAQLFEVDPTSAGSGLRGKPLCEKTYEIRPRDTMDIGDEPWPVSIMSPEIPVSMREEYDHRDQIRSGGAVPQQGQTGGAQAQASLEQASAYEMPQAALQAPLPPPPAAPPPATGLAKLLEDPKEFLLVAGGVVKLWREMNGDSGSNQKTSAQMDIERLRIEHDQRMQAAKEAHELRMEEMKAQREQLAADRAAREHVAPPSPAVSADAIRAEIRAEYLQREIESLKAQQAQAAKTPPERPKSLVEEIRSIAEVAGALGYKRGGGGDSAPLPQPTTLEQLGDLLSTPGGQTIASMGMQRLLNPGVPVVPPEVKMTGEGGEPPAGG